MNHQKEEVLSVAEGLWADIILSLTSIDPKFFNGRNQPCQICGGKDRARFIQRHDLQFHCNQCGDKSGINFYMELVGVDFGTAINDVGDYLNLVPVERREVAKRQHKIVTSFPSYYEFNMTEYDMIKQKAEIGISPWQRVSGLNFLDILRHGDYALLPLLNRSAEASDFIMVDVNGNWQTTGGNKSVPSGFYSTFGDEVGKRTYIAVSPFVSAHASVFTQKQVVCCYEEENILPVMNSLSKKGRVDISTREGKERAIECMERKDSGDDDCVVIVSSITETQEADTLKLPQLTYNAKNNTVNRRLYQPFEIMEMRK